MQSLQHIENPSQIQECYCNHEDYTEPCNDSLLLFQRPNDHFFQVIVQVVVSRHQEVFDEEHQFVAPFHYHVAVQYRLELAVLTPLEVLHFLQQDVLQLIFSSQHTLH